MPLVVRTNEGSPRAFRAWPLAWPRRQARRVGSGAQGSALALASDATAGSALDAGGADPDNARRSGPVSWPFAGRLAHLAGDDRSGQLAERMTHSAYGGVHATAGCGTSARRAAPATVRYRARGSGPGCSQPAARVPITPAAMARHSPGSFNTSPCTSRTSSTRWSAASRPGAPEVRPWFRAVLAAAGLNPAD